MVATDLEDLGLDRGGHLLVKRALGRVAPGDSVHVSGSAPTLGAHLRAWCRAQGHRFASADDMFVITKGLAEAARWKDAEAAGTARPNSDGAIAEHPSPRWGLAARGATVEAGSPSFDFQLSARGEVWADEAARLYQQAVARQWDPNTAIDWDTPFELPAAVEDAVVQVMTYLIENETAALIIPSRFIAQLHPHFREVMQLLAIQAADEARHIEVFTRRALLHRESLGLSTAGGQASLKTIVEEPDWATASFLLSVLGEGTFLTLLWFLRDYAPDPVTQRLVTLVAQDEARHVAFGMAHLKAHAQRDPGLLGRLGLATERRHDALRHTAGLNAEVFDALVLLAAGSFEVDAIRSGWDRVQTLQGAMHDGRRQRLLTLGFSNTEAERLSALHTRNFM